MADCLMEIMDAQHVSPESFHATCYLRALKRGWVPERPSEARRVEQALRGASMSELVAMGVYPDGTDPDALNAIADSLDLTSDFMAGNALTEIGLDAIQDVLIPAEPCELPEGRDG